MRILQIDSGRQMRGGQWQVLRLIEGLTAAGVDTWLAAPPDAPLAAMAAGRGLRVVRLDLAALRTPADLVHAHDARAHAWAAVLARAPVIVSRRVAFPIGTGLFSRWKYRRPAHYLAVSQFVRQGMLERGIPPEKISVVYDGVPLLAQSQRTGAVLAPAPSTDKPEEWYRQTGIEISFARDLAHDLRTASLFVYISRSEGLGSAVLMALAAGVPVVATRTGGISEIIRHEENGLLVDHNPRTVAEAIHRLQMHPDLAKMLASRGRQTILEKFSTDIMVRNTLDIYHRVRPC